MDILIQGWTPDDKVNPSDPVYWLKEAVEQRLRRIVAQSQQSGVESFPGDYMLGRTISSFQILQGVVRPPTPDVSAKSFFYIPVQVGLVRGSL